MANRIAMREENCVICPECSAACQAEGGLCGPMDAHSREAAAEAGIDADAAARDHRKTEHQMTLEGAAWRCRRGHTNEASGVEVMRAAGTEPLF